MTKQFEVPNFFHIAVLIFLLLFLSFILESYLVSRVGIDSSFAKLLVSSITLLTVLTFLQLTGIRFTKKTELPFDLCRIGWIAWLYLLCIGITVLGVSIELHHYHVSPNEFCSPSKTDYLELARTTVFAPALETLIFVQILPESFMHRYKRTPPVVAILLVATLFSIFHSPVSAESFICRFCGGIIFSYIYFVLNSLAGSFVVHAAHNLSLSAIAAAGGQSCIGISRLANELATPGFALGLLLTAYLVMRMTRFPSQVFLR